MEEQVSPQTNQTIYNSHDPKREVSLTLTVSQIKILTDLLEKHVEAKGYEMIKQTLDLFERLKIPSPFTEKPDTSEAFK